jgi:TatD DNase family protein
MFFDSHAHYDDEKFDIDRDDLILGLKSKDIDYVLNAGTDIYSSRKGIKFSQIYDLFYTSVGIHPHEVSKAKEEDINILYEMSSFKKVVAIGEIGLDYYYNLSPKQVQKEWFRKQIQLAKSLKLPVIIHDRDAHKDALDIIKEENISEIGGVFHCFSGSWEMAKVLISMGIYISFSGSITFKNAKNILEVVKNVPMDMFLIETDCPYLAPEPFRGKRNNSEYIRYTAEKIAEIKQISIEEVASVSMKSTKKLFNIE